jgi:hypothetical protein
MIQTTNIKAVAKVNAFVIAVVGEPTQFVLVTVGRAGSRFLRIWQHEAPGMAHRDELHYR